MGNGLIAAWVALWAVRGGLVSAYIRDSNS